jgi:hypothetical protein
MSVSGTQHQKGHGVMSYQQHTPQGKHVSNDPLPPPPVAVSVHIIYHSAIQTRLSSNV